ncbi:hypothetical protein E1B28_012393 [Marasmius oreades]|uniref:Uncharacterized protein n=1 Tax=Marasmius oreades TaxID=181124 RepID=A0A9P7RRK1_9AGAR|nr:uncharacterized protein E1B28_012393 [Marasmius oreades]KAG7088395.1 hypothetical protein E1B28_012393 [Marasmius oreades]
MVIENQPKFIDMPNVGAPGIPYFTPHQAPPAGTAVDPQPNGKPIPSTFKPLKVFGELVGSKFFVIRSPPYVNIRPKMAS